MRVSDERGRAVRAAGLGSWLARLAPARARGLVSVALVSDRRVRALNRTYRRQDYSTDVFVPYTSPQWFYAVAGQRGSLADLSRDHLGPDGVRPGVLFARRRRVFRRGRPSAPQPQSQAPAWESLRSPVPSPQPPVPS